MIANRHGRTFSLFSPVLLLGSLWGSSRPRGDVTSTVAQLAKRKKRATDRVLLPREASRRKECRGFDGKSTDEFLEFPQCIYPLPREFVVHRSILFRVEEAMHNALDFFFFFAFTIPRTQLQESKASRIVAERTALLSRAISRSPSSRSLYPFPRIFSRSPVVEREEVRKSARDSV